MIMSERKERATRVEGVLDDSDMYSKENVVVFEDWRR